MYFINAEINAAIFILGNLIKRNKILKIKQIQYLLQFDKIKRFYFKDQIVFVCLKD